MKAKLLSLVAAFACAFSASATTIWTGSEKLNWDWDGHHIDASVFAGLEQGDYLSFTFADCEGGWFDLQSLESVGTNFFEQWCGPGTASVVVPMTGDMHENFTAGINIYGAGLTVIQVDLDSYEHKELVNDNTVWFNSRAMKFDDPNWGSYVDITKDWFSTLDGELGWKLRLNVEGIDGIDNTVIVLSHYDWSGDFTTWTSLPENGVCDFVLDSEIITSISEVGGVKIRGYGFKLNTVELTTDSAPDVNGINTININVEASSAVYNLQGIKVSDNLDNLPSGLYIYKGKKIYYPRF